jgi:hypothetical protein
MEQFPVPGQSFMLLFAGRMDSDAQVMKET